MTSTCEKRPAGLNLTPRLKLLADHLLWLLFLTEVYNLPLFFKTLNLNVHVFVSSIRCQIHARNYGPDTFRRLMPLMHVHKWKTAIRTSQGLN